MRQTTTTNFPCNLFQLHEGQMVPLPNELEAAPDGKVIFTAEQASKETGRSPEHFKREWLLHLQRRGDHSMLQKDLSSQRWSQNAVRLITFLRSTDQVTPLPELLETALDVYLECEGT